MQTNHWCGQNRKMQSCFMNPQMCFTLYFAYRTIVWLNGAFMMAYENIFYILINEHDGTPGHLYSSRYTLIPPYRYLYAMSLLLGSMLFEDIVLHIFMNCAINLQVPNRDDQGR